VKSVAVLPSECSCALLSSTLFCAVPVLIATASGHEWVAMFCEVHRRRCVVLHCRAWQDGGALPGQMCRKLSRIAVPKSSDTPRGEEPTGAQSDFSSSQRLQRKPGSLIEISQCICLLHQQSSGESDRARARQGRSVGDDLGLQSTQIERLWTQNIIEYLGFQLLQRVQWICMQRPRYQAVQRFAFWAMQTKRL